MLSPQSFGLWGLWQSLQAMPPECSAVTTWGNVWGLAASFSWQRAAEGGHVGQCGLEGRGVVGLACAWRAVAGFAGHVGVFAAGADFALVLVAHDAGVLAGVRDGLLADGLERPGAVVAVLAEVLGHDRAANHQKDADSGQEHERGPDQVSRVVKQASQEHPPWVKVPTLKARKGPNGPKIGKWRKNGDFFGMRGSLTRTDLGQNAQRWGIRTGSPFPARVVLSDMPRGRLCRILLLAAAAALPADAGDGGFDAVVAPVLGTSCLQCHNAQMPSAGLDLTPFTAEASLRSRRAGWEKIWRKLAAGQMPPGGISRPMGLDEMLAFLARRLRSRGGGEGGHHAGRTAMADGICSAAVHRGARPHLPPRGGVRSGETQFYLVASDLCLFSPTVYAEAARTLESQLGIPRAQFWWSVTHTHSAPEVGPPDIYRMLLGRSDHEWDRNYTSRVIASLVEAVRTARERLEPARVAFGTGTALANLNRRAKDVDGQVSLGLNPEGPADRQVNLVRVERADGRPIALVVNYAMHGTVLSGQNLLVSGDAPGTVSAYLEQKLGAPVLYVNGAAGDLAPIYSVYPDARSGHLSQFKVLLGDRVMAALAGLPAATGEVTMRVGEQFVETPRRSDLVWPEELAAYAKPGSTPMVRLPVRFLRINDTVIWSAPVELFCEIAMDLRGRSPFARTFYFGYTNGWFGYLPTAKAFAEGGYEPRTSPFTAQAASDLERTVAAFLGDFGR